MRKRSLLSESNLLNLEYYYSHNEENAEWNANSTFQCKLPVRFRPILCADQFSLASLPLVWLFYVVTSKTATPQADVHRQHHCVLTLLRMRAPVLAYNRHQHTAESKPHRYPVHRGQQLKNKILTFVSRLVPQNLI